MQYTQTQNFQSNMQNAVARRDTKAIIDLLGSAIGSLAVTNRGALVKAAAKYNVNIPANASDVDLIKVVCNGAVMNKKFLGDILVLQALESQGYTSDNGSGYSNDSWLDFAGNLVDGISQGVNAGFNYAGTVATNATTLLGIQETTKQKQMEVSAKLAEVAAQAAATKAGLAQAQLLAQQGAEQNRTTLELLAAQKNQGGAAPTSVWKPVLITGGVLIVVGIGVYFGIKYYNKSKASAGASEGAAAEGEGAAAAAAV